MKYQLPQQLTSLTKSSVVQEIKLFAYHLELDFRHEFAEQQQFFQIHENTIPDNTNISVTFHNQDFQFAEMFCVDFGPQGLSYEIFITFFHHNWQHDVSLHKFIPLFRNLCNKQGMHLSTELEEDYGFYLKLAINSQPKSTIGERITSQSQLLQSITNDILHIK